MDSRWDPALLRRIVQIRACSAVSLGVALALFPALGSGRFLLSGLMIFLVPSVTLMILRFAEPDRLLVISTLVDMYWAVAATFLLPTVYLPAMMVAIAMLGFVANEDTRALAVGSLIGIVGFTASGIVFDVDMWLLHVVIFVLLLPLFFFMATTQQEREVRHQVRVRHRVEHDGLTGLRNRNGLMRAIEKGDVRSVIAIDLDGFKDINDTLGHDAGDSLLIALSERMAMVVGDEGVLARTGGDEFAVLLTDADASRMAGDLLRACRHRIALGEIDVSVGASLGIAFAELSDPVPTQELIRRADLAMYEAKRTQVGVRRWSGTTRSASHQRVSLSGDVERGFEEAEFELYFQPIVETGTGKIVDAEGLLRWHHPEKGFLEPASFLNLIEGIGRRATMDRLVFDQAAQLAAEVQSLNIGVSINLSAGSLMRSSVPGVLDEILRKYDVVPQRITVEVIEDEMIDEHSTARAVLGALGEIGVGIAIDDFGTGHSSLSRLRRLPVSALKIDRSFVSSMLTSDDDLAIVDAVSRLGRALELTVVAEGVEDLALRDKMVLDGLPIDRLQGFGIARPMPRTELLRWIGEREPLCVG